MTKWMRRINYLETKRQERKCYCIRERIKLENDKRYSDIVTEIDWITEKFKRELL